MSSFLFGGKWARIATFTVLGLLVTGLFTFTYFYLKFAKLIDDKLAAGPFTQTSRVFAAPQTIRLNEEVLSDEIVRELRGAGYTESRSNVIGWYNLRPDAVEIFPGPQSYFKQDPYVVKFNQRRVRQIISLRDNTERTQYQLEPALITNLFDRNRGKRRIVRFDDIPKVLLNAVVAVEDKRFFQHAGFDPLRIVKSAIVDISQGYRAQGGSTLSQQLARGIWLTPEKTWKRKSAEALMTLHLERKLTKEEIFEHYANNVDQGRRGSFAIHGFGEASQAYFGKNMKELTLPEAATLAGLIQRPSHTNPIRWPERAKGRRNLVLRMMLDNGYISEREYAVATAAPLQISRVGGESADAPYFVDLVNETLQDQLPEVDFQSKNYRVYTTLDERLQREASEAVRIGIKEVDDALAKRRKKGGPQLPEAQVALVALDAQTGEVKALIGGRNYGMSQLNRALAKRQPGSIFKPFVYAAAMNTALKDDGGEVITPVTRVLDEPTVFEFDGQEYEPGNFGGKSMGMVTLRTALSKSLNIPTVKLAEMVGYRNVVSLAKQSGLAGPIQATPAVALGAYEATPLEMAGAYTIYSNGGQFVKPQWIKTIYDESGTPIFEPKQSKRQVLDPRVAYMMVNLMEEVMRSGTGGGARSRGFGLPAAGKTGTSRDGWFAGFTSKLICVVWVGFDDNTDIKLEGAKSALPIWTEFMKRAHLYREYRGVRSFEAPDGVVSVEVDSASGLLASGSCPGHLREVFIAGTQPSQPCGSGSITHVASWDAEGAPLLGEAGDGRDASARRGSSSETQNTAQQKRDEKNKEKPGIWNKIRSIFK